MTNIEQFTRELMLAHDIDYETAQYRAYTFYENIAQDVPSVLNDWISVEDRLPEDEARCIVFSIDNGRYLSFPPFNECITHWQPLPEPPKEK